MAPDMFGGIAAAGADRIQIATFDGDVLLVDVDEAAVTAQFSVYPSGPRRVHASACAVAADGSVLLGDTQGACVRVFAPDGRQLRRVGALPTPGIEGQDDPGVILEPCALLAGAEGFLVASGGLGVRHGVQCFGRDGRWRFSFDAPEGGWRRAQGLARVGDAIWVAETEAGRIRRHDAKGAHEGDLALHEGLARPFRLAPDGRDGVLLLLEPLNEADEERFGVARLDDADASFQGWIVEPGEDDDRCYCPFDVAVLEDGRFVLADLPFGAPPDVRLRLFSADGVFVRTLFEDVGGLRALQRRWFDSVLARTGEDAATLYEQARAHHLHPSGSAEHLKKAGDLYVAALGKGDLFLAALGLGALLMDRLHDPAGAEEAYRTALELGGDEGELWARIAECRRARGDLDAAVRYLKKAVEAPRPPEDFHARLEELGTFYLERSGETPETVI